MRNTLFLDEIEKNLNAMRDNAERRNAPVFQVKSLTSNDPFRILVFTMLSSRTKDETTIKKADALFSIARTPQQIASLDRRELERILYGIGFYRVKARRLKELAGIIAKRKSVPETLDRLLELPGIGRKTANIVLGLAFGKDALGVDVHVHRISNRLGIIRTKKTEDSERELLRIIPQKMLRSLNITFVAFGQTFCTPRKPDCQNCPVRDVCWRVGVSKKQG